MPNMKKHQQGCLFVFSIVLSPYNTRRAQNNTSLVWFHVWYHHFVLLLMPNTNILVGVFSCSTSSLHPTMHAEHEKTPLLVSCHIWHLFSILPHTLSTTMHSC